MLHGIVHQLSMQIQTLTEQQKQAVKAKRAKKNAGETSFLEKRIEQVYQTNN